MNGFIARTLAVACLGAGLTTLGGCKLYECFVDPCYPERYEYQARQPIAQVFNTQAANGHVLDQTVWNYFFDAGTDKLTQGGLVYLDHLSRKRPQPDTKLFLQTAYDISYDPAAPEKLVNARVELDGKRVAAVQKYLQANTAGRPVVWEVAIHDPSGVGIGAVPQGLSIQRHYAGAQGSLPNQGTGPGLTSGGPTGPSSR